ncbi:MAG: ABC transporter ATP-binding protein [Candidatus Dormibacteraeota bacterium]|nr:ABC transporter ATP-binding protein [Candidatus Dormibacteraeota bacterium]
MGEFAVEVRGLRKKYGERAALDGLDLTVPEGSLTTLLGPNGAGKTTTIEILEGFRRADGGAAQVLGRDPAREGRRLRVEVGVMLQEGGLYPTLACADMLRLAARQYADPLPVAPLLAGLGLEAVARTRVRRLSGGERQRLALAVAIVGRPRLVFLDEPTAGLDLEGRHRTWSLLERLRAGGVTILLTTHHLEEAERLSDQVRIIAHGRLVAAGTPRELAMAGAEPGLRFVARSGVPVGELAAALPGEWSASEPAPGHYRLEGTVGPDALAAVTRWCTERGILIEQLEVGGRRSLEETYLALTEAGR